MSRAVRTLENPPPGYLSHVDPRERQEAVTHARVLIRPEASRIGITPHEAERFIRCGYIFADLCAVNGPNDLLAMIADRTTTATKRPTLPPIAINHNRAPGWSMAHYLDTQACEQRKQQQRRRAA